MINIIWIFWIKEDDWLIINLKLKIIFSNEIFFIFDLVL